MPVRQADYIAAAARVYQAAIDCGAAFVVLGGDNFEMQRPEGTVVEALQSMVSDASVAGVPTYGIEGNHDPSGSAWLRVCGIQPLERWDGNKPVITPIGGISVFGISYTSPSKLRDKLALLSAACFHFDVLVLHVSLADMWGMGIADLTAAEVADAIKPCGCGLVLLGDIHNYMETVINDVRFIYPGSPEITAVDESRDKSVSIIEFGADGKFATAYMPLSTRPCLRAVINSQDDIDALVAAITADTSGMQPVVVAEYGQGEDNLKGRLMSALEGRAFVRPLPAALDTGADTTLAESVKKHEFDRGGAMKMLREVIETTLDGADARRLAADCAAAPDSVDAIVDKYMKEKGL